MCFLFASAKLPSYSSNKPTGSPEHRNKRWTELGHESFSRSQCSKFHLTFWGCCSSSWYKDVPQKQVITQSISSTSKFGPILSWTKKHIKQPYKTSTYFHPEIISSPLTSKDVPCFPSKKNLQQHQTWLLGSTQNVTYRRRPARPLHVKWSSIWPTAPSSKGSRSHSTKNEVI